ncbi:NUDIX domain-containing protein [Amycolatopsis sp. NPDC004079]|uniref:NUDIX domain-containing protein n=1 Tax=Amycolatopsis sp. NPDC004079 TaxID=3154549 RepID=UPI0033AC03B8
MDSATKVTYTADVVLFADIDGVRHVLLVTRSGEPFKGRRALPGGRVDPQDGPRGTRAASRNAAIRETHEETDIVVRSDQLRFVGTWDKAGRDPRGNYSTDVYTALLADPPRAIAGSDAADAAWVPLSLALKEPLAFDHSLILPAAAAITA